MQKLIALLSILYAGSVSANLPDEDQWQFEVSLDGKKIGYHDFVLSTEGDNQLVQMEAKFNVKLLFVNVFSYFHENEEMWQGDCLASINAETVANGDDYVVRGKAMAEEFQLQSAASEDELPSCIMTFAYWNPEFLKAEKLLNSQTGAYEDVDIRREGEEELLVNGQEVPAIKYSVEGPAAPITLWYAAADHRWLALESVVRGGRVLRYSPTNS